MGGFAGWLTLDGAWTRSPDPRLGTILSQALDGVGLELSRSWHGEGVLLTHRRRITAPQDLADRQPRRDGRSPLVLVFDGYLINREELADALGWAGEAVASRADSAFALAALERWGEQGPSRLLGDFALALWNESERTLLLARDGVGQRPLYYHEGRGFFAFATTPRALLALPGVPDTLDEGRFARSLLDLPGDPEGSFYTAIRRLQPGQQAILSEGRLRHRRYWEPDYGRRLILKRDDDYVEAARELLDRAVKACLRIEGTPVAALTGGLDSSAVAVTALPHLPGGRLATVTAVHSAPVREQEGGYSDERPLVEAIARMHPGLDPAFLSGSGLHRWDERWTEMFLRTGIPWRNIMNIAWLGPARDHARTLGARVLLSGALGNASLSWGGLEVLPGAFRGGQWGYVAREVRALAAAGGTTSLHQLWRRVLSPMLTTETRSRIDRLRGRHDPAHWLRHSAIRPNLARELALEEETSRQKQAFARPAGELRRAHFTSLQQLLETAGLSRAMHGLEMRAPLADRRLLEFCFAVPEAQYLRAGIPRALARRVLADRLPAAVTDNRLSGLQGADFFHRMTLQRSAIAEGIAALERSALACRLLDVPRMRRMLDDWPSDTAQAGPEYLSVLHRGLHYGQFLRWLEGGNG